LIRTNIQTNKPPIAIANKDGKKPMIIEIKLINIVNNVIAIPTSIPIIIAMGNHRFM
jgi:hypothetical protein